MVETSEVDLEELGINEPADGPAPQFGDETRYVNALRARSLWLRGSVRLLSDLIELTRDEVQGLESDNDLIMRARLASPMLIRSLSLRPNRRPRSAFNQAKTRPHRIWVVPAKGLEVPLEALTHILAHAVTAQFGEPTAVVTFGNDGWRTFWRASAKPGDVHHGEVHNFPSGADLYDAESPDFSHQFFVAPNGINPALALGDLYGRMHRIVYLTRQLPRTMPCSLFPLLYPAVRRRVDRHGYECDGSTARIVWTAEDEGPYFSSFVAAVIDKPDREKFATEAVDEEFDFAETPKRREGWRVDRDHCRVFLDRDAVETAWKADGDRPDQQFHTLLQKSDVNRIAARWARAVTNRSVGLALSGGGASSYALVPLIRALHERSLPIDVLSGVSGGAFLGAFYCKNQLDGLDRAIEVGWLYQLGLLPNVVISEVGRRIVDLTVGRTWMGETEIKFLPVTIKLEPDESPRAHRVVSGTLGEAVQVSGAAPALFAPVVKWLNAEGPTRFADGGLAMLIPARILRDQGADLLFACNCLPSPESSNPLRQLPGGEYLYNLPFAGGAVDLWMSAAYMQGRFSRAVNPDVSGFYEVKAEKAPLLKSFFFAAAEAIVNQAKIDGTHERSANEFYDQWKTFITHPASQVDVVDSQPLPAVADALQIAKRSPSARRKATGNQRSPKDRSSKGRK